MADENGKTRRATAGEDKTAEDRSQCTPCRGTGKISSNLGGAAHDVVCPWCDGTGAFQPGRDAQESAGRETPA
jgi:DnaJ-class molecular chaperone